MSLNTDYYIMAEKMAEDSELMEIKQCESGFVLEK